MSESLQGPPGGRAGIGFPERVARLIRRDGPLIALDMGIVVSVYMVALVLRFDGTVPTEFWTTFRVFIPIALVIHLLTNYMFGLYGRMWRYASVHEARRLVLAGMVAGTILLVAALTFGRMRLLPISVVVFGATLSLLGFGAVRFQSRLFALRRRTVGTTNDRVLIVGAGEATAKLLSDIVRHPSLKLDPIGLIDDDPKKMGLTLNGVMVLGNRWDLPMLAIEHDVDQVLLAIPSATSEVVRDIAERCEAANIPLRVLPSVHEMVGGKITARDIRDLQIEDLLGRQQVQIDPRSVEEMLRGKRVLITGGGGSIGSELARQVELFDPAGLVLLDNDETHLHDAAINLSHAMTVLGDIRNRTRIEQIFEEHQPQVVFHAAAHKHVPLLERHPEEAFETNVLGTATLADLSVSTDVERFVLISTDKAVNPMSIMGVSKRMAEQVIWLRQGGGTRFSAVRFGNVLGSRGSVIPTFLQQIVRGGPVTLTDPRMTRYFMSLHEATQLVLQASALARGGDVFTLDMGEPVRILELAQRLIRLSGRVPQRDVAIEVVGIRPGEKLDEDVRDVLEHSVASIHPSIRVSRPISEDAAVFERTLKDLAELARRGERAELADKMRRVASHPAPTRTP